MSLKRLPPIWLFLYFAYFICNYAAETENIVIIILSQANDYHTRISLNCKHRIQNEAKNLNKKEPIIYISHIDLPHIGDWTVLPLIPKLASLYLHNIPWFIFIEDRTEIKLENLLKTLKKYNENEDIWLGYALHDEDATIIHHFAFYKNPKSFKYPNLSSGFAMSRNFLQKLANSLENPPNIDFNIDNSHELALYIWKNLEKIKLTHEPSFCISKESFCSTYPQLFHSCNQTIPNESMYFAVKTCSKYNKDRVPVVKKTWAPGSSKINFFSDVEDKAIPTINLGIANTETGHCAKTVAILKYSAEILKEDSKIKWVILADDDTLISTLRLRKLLTCYDSKIPIMLGERYGYNVLNPEGYNYITGGGGIVFSRTLVELVSQPGICECPSISSPDDMYLGICAFRVGAEIIHSPFFHQARPMDYSKDYLETHMAISFHKHWNVDPLFVYENWLTDVDVPDDKIAHTEL